MASGTQVPLLMSSFIPSAQVMTCLSWTQPEARAHEEASQLLTYLVQLFPSREIWNNLGVAKAIGALKLAQPGEVYL